MRGQDNYKEVITITLPNMIARVHIPDLTKEEQDKRMQKIYKASFDLLETIRKGV